MIKYPNGKKLEENVVKKNVKEKRHLLNAGNRGMNLENDINISNEYYLDNNIALITKRPTPINVVKVDYSKGAVITNAYFEHQSTTDYNGVYKGRYIDFEAKATKSRTSFPLSNITSHQIKHLKRVLEHGGIAFFIISFESHNKVFLLDAKYIIEFYEKPQRKSIPFDDIVLHGHEIKQGIRPRLYYIDIVEEVYFK